MSDGEVIKHYCGLENGTRVACDSGANRSGNVHEVNFISVSDSVNFKF